MGIGLSGMVSGLDTDSIVQAMVSAQKTKSTKIENKITLNKWTTEAWSSLNTKVYSFYTKFASKLRLQSSYMTRTAKSSNESAVTAKAGSSAAVGTHSLEIHSLASSQYVTGGQLKVKDENGVEKKANYTTSTKLTDVSKDMLGTTISIEGKDGKKVDFTVESDSTIKDFLDSCKDAGLNANFDTSQQRFFISSMESGAENAFSITAKTSDVIGLDNVKSRVAEEFLSAEEKTLYNNALDVLSKAARENPDSIDAAIAKIKAVEAEVDEKGNPKKFDVKTASELEKAIYDVRSLALDSRAAKMADSIVDTTNLSEKEAAEKKAEVQNLIQNADAEINPDKYTAEEIAAIESSRETLGHVEKNILGHMGNLSATAPVDTELSALGLGTISKDTEVKATDDKGMTVVKAADAEFILNGAKMTESSNSFTVNGITLNLSATTYNKTTGEHDAVQITVGKDSESTFDLVKEALTEYNKLIEEMNKLYDADSARGYDPLTDEQKEAMTEDDIKNWEDKIKGSLLRRDNTLSSLLSGMRTALSSTYTDEETGKTYSLSTFGIVTGNYTEKGKLHIYGDADDATYATYEDRLKKALEEDPDQVMETLTHVFGKLYDTMTEKCAKTEISSALTFYNDKQYNTLLKDYEEDLDIMNDRIAEMEDKYYKQFTAMETALSKLQSQTNALASLLGSTTAQ